MENTAVKKMNTKSPLPQKSLAKSAPAKILRTQKTIARKTQTKNTAPKGKREENRIRKSQQIKQASLSLFVKHGIETVTIDDIVKKAKIAKGSFYQYFKNKEDLVKELFKPIKKNITDAIDDCKGMLLSASCWNEVLQSYATLVLKISPVIMKNKKITILYLQESKAPTSGARRPARKLGQFISDAAIDLTKIAHERGHLKKFPPEISALAVIGAAERLIFAFLVEKKPSDPTATGHTLASIVLNGLQPNRTKD